MITMVFGGNHDDCVASAPRRQRQLQARDGSKSCALLGGNLHGKKIAVLGLTFKPDTDDMREAPSIPLVICLLDMGARVRAFDPVGVAAAKTELPDIAYGDAAYGCADGADALVIVTEWVQFRALDLDRLKAAMKHPVVIDLRNVYRPEEMAAAGFVYQGVGRGSV